MVDAKEVEKLLQHHNVWQTGLIAVEGVQVVRVVVAEVALLQDVLLVAEAEKPIEQCRITVAVVMVVVRPIQQQLVQVATEEEILPNLLTKHAMVVTEGEQ